MGASARVLVIDDDQSIGELLELVLADEGYEVQSLTDCQSALKLVQEWTPDLILLDLRLPGMDGTEFLEAFRQKAPEIPVMLVSAATDLEQQAARLAVSDTVRKPFDINELCMAVHQIAAQTRAGQPVGPASHEYSSASTSGDDDGALGFDEAPALRREGNRILSSM